MSDNRAASKFLLSIFRKLTVGSSACWVQVLARSSPTDKFNLVKLLKEVGEVVAVTGDGETQELRLCRAAVLCSLMACATSKPLKEALLANQAMQLQWALRSFVPD